MKLLVVTFLSMISISAISQEDRESIFKSMDDSIKINPATLKAKRTEPKGLNGKVKFIVEDSYLPDKQKQEQPGLKVSGNCYKYWYSKEGRLERRQNYFDTTVYSDEIFLYVNGLLRQTIIRTRSKTGSVDYTYDTKGFLIKEVHSSMGRVYRKKVFNYDSIGRVRVDFEFGDGFKSISRNDYHYKGNQLDLIVHSNGRTSVEYYPNGLLKQERLSIPGSLLTTLYKYDKHSNIAEKSQPELKATHTFKYEYDKQFNWLIKYDYFEGELVSITKRTIEYY